MEITEFLRKYVEGYLFEDLNSMAAITVAPGRVYGAVVYPMVATALAGIELMGNLLQTKPFDHLGGRTAFLHFWSMYLYPPPSPSSRLGESVYALARHGLDHVFLPKPGILATKNRVPEQHLHRDADGSLVIDAIVLSDDLRHAYDTHVRPLLDADRPTQPPDRASMQERLTEIIQKYTAQSRERSDDWLVLEPSPRADSLIIQINSPTPSTTIGASATKKSPQIRVPPSGSKG